MNTLLQQIGQIKDVWQFFNFIFLFDLYSIFISKFFL